MTDAFKTPTRLIKIGNVDVNVSSGRALRRLQAGEGVPFLFDVALTSDLQRDVDALVARIETLTPAELTAAVTTGRVEAKVPPEVASGLVQDAGVGDDKERCGQSCKIGVGVGVGVFALSVTFIAYFVCCGDGGGEGKQPTADDSVAAGSNVATYGQQPPVGVGDVEMRMEVPKDYTV